jgi:hypothetical protein
VQLGSWTGDGGLRLSEKQGVMAGWLRIGCCRVPFRAR